MYSVNAGIAIVMAALVGGGGFMGFNKKGSKMSLLAGGGTALVYAWCAYMMLGVLPLESKKGANNVAIGASALLAVGMGARAVMTEFAKIPTMVSVLGLASAAAFYLLQ